jgi:acyl transferase domain-containing protein/short-subunit dehydrogenase
MPLSTDAKSAVPLAIIGMACRLPGADDLDQFWQLLVEGRSAVGELPPDRLDQELYYDPRKGVRGKTYSKLGAIISSRQFHHDQCPIPEDMVRSADPCHLLMCEVAAQACRHAGLDPFHLPARNTGVFIGHAQGSGLAGDYTYGTCVEEAAQFLCEAEDFRTLPVDQQQAVLAELVAEVRGKLPRRTAEASEIASSGIAGTISRAFGLSGPYLAINSACASSLQAMLLAARALQLGRVEMAIVGGASDCKSDSLVLFSHAQALSATGSRPFDAQADGLIIGEGYVCLVMKTLERALADGDHVLAVVRGVGVSSDGRGKSLWAPRQEGQIRAMQRAYRNGLDMGQLQYLEAHATATQVGDATELNTVAEVLKDVLPPGRKIPITSVKANIGHTLESAGMSGVIKVVLAMQHRTIPPAINITKLNPKIDWERVPVYVPTAPIAWPDPAPGQPRRAGVNAFGIGGLNMHLVLDEFDESLRSSAAPALPSAGKNASDDNAIAIVGMGCVLPGAGNLPKYWELLAGGRDPTCQVPPDRWRSDLGYRPGVHEPYRSPATRGGFITDFQYDWRAHKLPPKQVAQADPLQFMLLEAADEALKDAGYDRRQLDRAGVGVVVGTEFGGDFACQLQMGLRLPAMQRILSGLLAGRGLGGDRVGRVQEQFARALLDHWPALIDETGSFSTSSLASRISKTWDLMGGAATIDAGAASSLAALAISVDMLLCGDCDMMVCAAGQRRMGLPAFEALALAGLLSTSPQPRAPFDAQADGYVPGEGVGVLLLKRLPDAIRDGDKIRGVIRGLGTARADEQAEAFRQAMCRGLNDAATRPQEIALLETDGSARPAADQQQVEALLAVQSSPRQQPLLVGSVVGQIGHAGGASGMASLLKAVLEIEHREVPRTVGLETPLPSLANGQTNVRPALQPSPVTTLNVRNRPMAAVSSCSKDLVHHVILEAGTAVSAVPHISTPSTAKAATHSNGEPAVAALLPAVAAADWQIVRVGAASLDELLKKLSAAGAEVLFSAAARSRFCVADRFRAAIVAASPAALAEKLASAAKMLADEATWPALAQRGIFCRQLGLRRPRIAFLFPGQGSQYAGMLRELIHDVPAAAAASERCSEIMGRHACPTLAQIAWSENPQFGSDVFLTQIAMLVADAVMLAAVEDRGIRPALVAGHSYGEYPALLAAGVWDMELALRVTRARCDAIQGCPTARGAMLAAAAPLEAVEEVIAALGEPVFVANHNAPDQVVVAGAKASLEWVAAALTKRSYASRMLAVPGVFHTPLMQGAADSFARALKAFSFGRSQVPLFSSVTNRYLAGPEEVPANLAAQLITPVRYVDLVRQITSEQATVLVEVGPQQALTRLNRKILNWADAASIASDDPKRPAVEQLCCVQALLECCGALEAMEQPATPAASVSRAALGPHEISHFDATARRREKMRQSATSKPIAPAASATNGEPPAAHAPGVGATAVLPQSANTESPATAVRTPVTGPAGEDLEKFLIKFVVEQTGYPPEVVELDADLEADLGIDSIKKAQLFGELREYFDVTPSENLTLDDFPTLRHVLNYLQGVPLKDALSASAPTVAAVAAPVPDASEVVPTMQPERRDSSATAAPTSVTSPAGEDLEKFLINFVVEQTGYPPEVVELDADLEADLGIDSIKKAQLFGELREYFDVTPSENLTLDDFPTLRHVLNYLQGAPAKEALKATTPIAAAAAPTSSAPAILLSQPEKGDIGATAAPALVTGPAGEDLEKFLINFVVEQTGYPPEVVELDADLEADLGIDSIKKAQLFGELREYFDVTPSENLTLDDFPTLRHVLNYLQGAPAKGGSSDATPIADFALPDAKPSEPNGTVTVTAELGTDGVPEVICVAGSPRQMGMAHGEETKEAIEAILCRYADLDGQALDKLASNGHATENPLSLFSPEQLEELEGLADSVDAPLGNLVAHNRALFADLGSECVQFVASDSVKTLVHGWHGRVPISAALGESLKPVIQIRRPTGGMPYALFSFVGAVGALGGMNAAGLTITCARSTAIRGGAASVAHGDMARAVLQEATDLESAIAILRHWQGQGNWKAQVSHAATGQMCWVHCDGGALDVCQSSQCLLTEATPAEFCPEIQAKLNAIPANSFGPAAFRQALQRTCTAGITATTNGHQDMLSVILDVQRREVWIRHGSGKTPVDFTCVPLARWFEPLALADRPKSSQPASGEPSELSQAEAEDELFEEERHTQRFVMRMVDAPLKADTPAAPAWSGAALMLGHNPAADAMRQLLAAQGVQVHELANCEDVDAMLAQFEQLWKQGPIPHVFLMSGRDPNPGDLGDPAAWAEHLQRDAVRPYFLCQRWLQLAADAKLLDRCTLVTATALGGDLGFSGDVRCPGGGALTGLTKAIWLEYVIVRKLKSMAVKIVDAPEDEPPQSLAANILRELAADTLDYEMAFVGGRRRLQNAVYQAAGVQRRAPIRPGAVWVATGGARGITAASALELGRRFGLRLHLIGTSPSPQVDPSWRNLSAEGLKSLKAVIMREARQTGQAAPQAWQHVEKALEMDRWLTDMAAAGVRATYHCCDVSDAETLAVVLDEIRRVDGPIEGILHGAGIDRATRFEKKKREDVLATIDSKVSGAYHLMRLTQNDPVAWFIGYGSISGRLGSNGQTDYALASDMLCKLISWYRTRRPECHAIGFHWHPWEGYGMAAKPEVQAALISLGAPAPMSSTEGLRHLLREVYAGGPRSEVLITDWDYHQRFYGPGANEKHPDGIASGNGKPSAGSIVESAPAVSRIARRFVLRTFDAPLPAGTPATPPIEGAACILGDNPEAEALQQRLVAQGVRVHMLSPRADAQVVIAELERLWTTEPATTFFVTTACDREAARIDDRHTVEQCRPRFLLPYLVVQRWYQLLLAMQDAPRGTLVAVTHLGGDFGYSQAVAAPEGGVLSGLLKSLWIETSRRSKGHLRIKVVDVPADETPQSVAQAICEELAADDPEIEVGRSGRRRCVVRPVAQPSEELPRHDICHGGTWVITGGARGITAVAALSLARRYGLTLHLIGTTPAPREDAPWRHYNPEELKQFKAQVIREALAAGHLPDEAWDPYKRDLEIDVNLGRFAANGVKAVYHCCDLADRAALAHLLNEIRSADGPIRGILHGAGYGHPDRFEFKKRQKIERAFQGKVVGAINLMALTRPDPLEYFVAFGSLAGRFGGNGLSDYAAANDMLAKLFGWYRRQRPDCPAACLDWQTWADVGMSTKADDVGMVKNELKMEFISPEEGCEHLHQELRAGLPEGEVLITDGYFQRTFYPKQLCDLPGADAPSPAPPVSHTLSRPTRPLIHSVELRPEGGLVAQVLFDPVADVFLREHRLKGKPFLPGVVGIEALCEAAAMLAPERTVVGLRDLEIQTGVTFHDERPVVATITVEPLADGVACTLSTELRDRKGRVIQSHRVHARGVVELGDLRPELKAPPPGEPFMGWIPHQYAEDGLLYHGSPLRCLKEFWYQYDGGWGKIVVPPTAELAGSRPAEGWINSVAVLDACVVTCGSFVFVQFGGSLEVPYRFDRLRFGRPPREGETCILRIYFRNREGRNSRFDFTLFGENNDVLLQAEGYQTVLIAEGQTIQAALEAS